MKYAIVIPAKNEEANLEELFHTIAGQSLPPIVCLLIDDDSTDQTKEIFDSFKKTHKFFDYYKTEGSIEYRVGAHIANLFKLGVKILQDRKYQFDYVVKLDADTVFDKDLFDKIRQRLEDDSYGICSPSYYVMDQGKRKNVFSPIWHTNGQFKIYQLDCFRDIGGLVPGFGWDCADNIMAMDKGWKTEAFRDIFFHMKRPIGRFSLFEAKRRQGIGAYKLGYHPLYLLIKGVYGFLEKPYFTASLVYWYHYVLAAVGKHDRILNKRQRKLLRKKYWEGLFSRFRKKEFSLLQKS